ncbi:MAG: hypothetical protein DRI57_15315 [Deltaproteobacteria bacterium]|nr:MAG: hypothetical protein DRI57_15315 [Deltaproteobacteria bacterium]
MDSGEGFLKLSYSEKTCFFRKKPDRKKKLKYLCFYRKFCHCIISACCGLFSIFCLYKRGLLRYLVDSCEECHEINEF